MRRILRACFNWKVLVALVPIAIAVVALAPGLAWVVGAILVLAVPLVSLLGRAFVASGVTGPHHLDGGREALSSRMAEIQQDEVRRLRGR